MARTVGATPRRAQPVSARRASDADFFDREGREGREDFRKVRGRENPGSTRVPRVGFGVPPKRTFRTVDRSEIQRARCCERAGKSAQAGRLRQHSGRVCYPDSVAFVLPPAMSARLFPPPRPRGVRFHFQSTPIRSLRRAAGRLARLRDTVALGRRKNSEPTGDARGAVAVRQTTCHHHWRSSETPQRWRTRSTGGAATKRGNDQTNGPRGRSRGHPGQCASLAR